MDVKTLFDIGNTLYDLGKPIYDWLTKKERNHEKGLNREEELKRKSNERFSSGLQLLKRKRYNEAKHAFEEAIHIYPENINARKHLEIVNKKIRNKRNLIVAVKILSFIVFIIILIRILF